MLLHLVPQHNQNNTKTMTLSHHATMSKLGRNRKAKFTECSQGLVVAQSGGHDGHSCKMHHEPQLDRTRYEFSDAAVSTQTSPAHKAAKPTNQPSLFSRIKRAVIQTVSKHRKMPQPALGPKISIKASNFKKAEGAFPFKGAGSLFPSKNSLEPLISPAYDPYADPARPLCISLETVTQTSQTVFRPPPRNAAAPEVVDLMDDDRVDKIMREEMARYKGKAAGCGGITRNRRGTNRKREPPSRRVGPYRKSEDGLSNDPFIGPLQRSMSNAKKDLKRTLSKPPFTPPAPKPSAPASKSSDFLAQFWDCDSDAEVRSSHSTVEQEYDNRALCLEE